MQNESKPATKPSRTRRLLEAFFPYRTPARDALRPAVDGAEIVMDLIAKIKRQVNPTPPALSPELAGADAAERFRRQCQRHGVDKIKLQAIERALLNTKRVYLAFTVLLPIYSIYMLAVGSFADYLTAIGCLAMAPLAFTLSMRQSVRLRWVRARRAWGWPGFCASFQTKLDMAAYFLDPEF